MAFQKSSTGSSSSLVFAMFWESTFACPCCWGDDVVPISTPTSTDPFLHRYFLCLRSNYIRPSLMRHSCSSQSIANVFSNCVTFSTNWVRVYVTSHRENTIVCNTFINGLQNMKHASCSFNSMVRLVIISLKNRSA